MRRITMALRIQPGKKEELRGFARQMSPILGGKLGQVGIGNFSIWSVEDLVFCYGEAAADQAPAEETAFLRHMLGSLSDCADPIGDPFDRPMRLMYEDIGIVRQDKSLIRHRVFVTKLKPGTAEEYKRRHDALVATRLGAVNPGPESNFTIWNGGDYIFGYCELVKAMEHEPTASDMEAKVAWETRMLEIMDWLTDDVDWLTGLKHERIENLYRQG